MRSLCLILCLATLTYSVAPAAAAQDHRSAASMSDEEDRALAVRAAETPQLESFKGGTAILVVAIALVVLISVFVFISVWISDIGQALGSAVSALGRVGIFIR